MSEKLYELNLKVAMLEGWELDPLRPSHEGQIRRLNTQRPSYDHTNYIVYGDYHYAIVGQDYSPATNWNQGGPIVETYGINVHKSTFNNIHSFAIPVYEYGEFIGVQYDSSSFLETAMTAYIHRNVDISIKNN